MTTDQRGSVTTTPSRWNDRQVDLAAAARHARGVGGAGDAGGHRGRAGLVEHARDDVFLAQLRAPDAGGDRPRGGHLHLVVHRPRPRIEQAPDGARAAEHVVGLVWVIGAGRSHYLPLLLAL